MKALNKSYPTKLSNRQWQLIKPFIPPAKPGSRPRTVDRRAILNAIFYLLVSGCAWSMLPGDFPRFSKDYEVLPETQDVMVYGAMVRLMVMRLA